MPKYLALLAALTLAACADSSSNPTIKTVSSVAPGNYRVAQFVVEPSPELMVNPVNGTLSDVAQFKQEIMPLMLQQMPQHGQGAKDVGMTIAVVSLRSKIDPVAAVLKGGHVQVETRVTLWDMTTKKVIGNVPLTVTSENHGPLGLEGDNSSDQTPQQNIKLLAQKYVSTLVMALYPAKP